MDVLFIVLRILHIISGMFWVGAGLIMYFFVGPTLAATADAGQKFAQHLMTRTRFTAIITISALLTVLAGAVLYWLDSDGLSSLWMRSGAGLGFGVGAGFGLLGLVFGIIVGNSNSALAKLGTQIQGKPTPQQMTQINALRKRLALVSPLNVYSLLLASFFMAIARYLRL